jgi:arabinan endo-1,5-alpha-L-arabinosidase
LRPAEPAQWRSLAKRERSVLIDDAEAGLDQAPFIFRKRLLPSWDHCCRGISSDRKVVVGRARGLTDPTSTQEERMDGAPAPCCAGFAR